MQQIHIRYDEGFAEEFQRLPKNIQRKIAKAERLFRSDIFHPSLRIHKLHGKLKGLWSISADRKYRIIFEYMEKDTVVFHSVGAHDIYEDLA